MPLLRSTCSHKEVTRVDECIDQRIMISGRTSYLIEIHVSALLQYESSRIFAIDEPFSVLR